MSASIRCTCSDVANCRRPHGYIPVQFSPPITPQRQALYERADFLWAAVQAWGGGKTVPATDPNSGWYRRREAAEFSRVFQQLTAPFNEYHT